MLSSALSHKYTTNDAYRTKCRKWNGVLQPNSKVLYISVIENFQDGRNIPSIHSLTAKTIPAKYQLSQYRSWYDEVCPLPHNRPKKMLTNLGTQSSRQRLKTAHGPSNIISSPNQLKAANTHLIICSYESHKSLCNCLNWKHGFFLRRSNLNQGQFQFHRG